MKTLVASLAAVLIASYLAGTALAGDFSIINLTPGYDPSCAYGINASGQVVGEIGQSGSQQAFLYSNGVTTNLGAPPGEWWAIATGINNNGQIVGYSNSYYFHAFVYSGGQWNTMGLPQGYTTSSWGYGINDSGQVVGESDSHAYLYSGGTATQLTSLVTSGPSWAV